MARSSDAKSSWITEFRDLKKKVSLSRDSESELRAAQVQLLCFTSSQLVVCTLLAREVIVAINTSSIVFFN